MAEHRPLPKTACLLCGVIMPERMLKLPWGHDLKCPVQAMKRVPSEAEKRKREKQERESA